MYELTCPACRHVKVLPFVRPGAMARCPSCGHVRGIVAEAIRRVPVGAPAAAAEGPDPLAGGSTDEEAGEVKAEIDEEAEAAVGSPLARAATWGRSSASADADAQAADDAPVLMMPFQRRIPAPRRWGPTPRQAAAIGLLALAAFVLVFAALSAWGTGGRFGGRNTSATKPSRSTRAPWDPNLPMVPAVRLGEGAWEVLPEESVEPYRPPPPSDAFELDDGKLDLADAEHLNYTAQLATTGPDTYPAVILRLFMIDEKERVIARTSLTLALLAPGRPQPISIAVPVELYHRYNRVAWRVEPGSERLRGAAPFSDALVAPLDAGERTAVRITAFNPLEQPMRTAVFILTAVGSKGQPLGTWSAIWSQPVSPRQRVEFAALVPVPDDRRLSRWQVAGVAAP